MNFKDAKTIRDLEQGEDVVSVFFNGKVTLEGPRGHRTFLLETAQKGKLKGKRIVSLLVGTDNQEDYQAFGFITETGINVWRKFQSKNGRASDYEIYADMLNVRCGSLPSKYDKNYDHYDALVSRNCIICDRELTHPRSIRRGIGPGPHKGG